MNSEVKVFAREDGQIQRVHVVRFDDWSQFDFLPLKGDKRALQCFYEIYKNFLIPTMPWIFPQMVMFQLPENVEVADGVKDKLLTASKVLQQGVKLRGGKPVFSTKEAKALWEELEANDCVRIVCGKFPKTKIIPVGDFVGYMSECEQDAQMKVNANFFIMDPIDCATIYDQVGRPFGLCVRKGVVTNPPLFEREALLVKKDGSVSVQPVDLKALEIEINGVLYKHGENATIYTRPERKKTPRIDGNCIVVVGNHVVDVKENGPVDIPASGFVICANKESFVAPRTLADGTKMKECPFCETMTTYVDVKSGDEVIYHGLEDIAFGLQVGNSIMRDGVKTNEFISRFYDIHKFERVPFPPSLYPMDFEGARAARIALGADKDGKPVVFWAEGKGKISYTPGQDSTGASLSEMADIAEEIGLYNAINLDGGGSAQILLDNKRSLHISDRKVEDNSDAERLVPMGLIVK